MSNRYAKYEISCLFVFFFPTPSFRCYFFYSIVCFVLILFRCYINYKLMKKKVNRYRQQIEVGTQNGDNFLMDFSRLLDCEVIFAIINDSTLCMTSPEEAQKPMISCRVVTLGSYIGHHLRLFFHCFHASPSAFLHFVHLSCSYSVLLSLTPRFSVSHCSLGEHAELNFL